MIQVTDLRRKPVAALVVMVDQRVGLRPEDLFVDPIAPKQGRLHVLRDEGLVEVPDAGDDALGEKRSGHPPIQGRKPGSGKAKGLRASPSGSPPIPGRSAVLPGISQTAAGAPPKGPAEG